MGESARITKVLVDSIESFNEWQGRYEACVEKNYLNFLNLEPGYQTEGAGRNDRLACTACK